MLPLLVPHLQASSYVIHTYAAITIERILFIKVNSLFLLSQSDLRPYSESILSTLLKKIKTGATPEKVAENEALMKAVMRVIITSRQALTPYYVTVLGELVSILGEISKNPSNPKFNLYTFESISALVRYGLPLPFPFEVLTRGTDSSLLGVLLRSPLSKLPSSLLSLRSSRPTSQISLPSSFKSCPNSSNFIQRERSPARTKRYSPPCSLQRYGSKKGTSRLW